MKISVLQEKTGAAVVLTPVRRSGRILKKTKGMDEQGTVNK